ncbi:hypothetical protein N9C31_00895 [Gammaproteobacteria bacterium]|nr:hypothetical protein [Gammaproteobacteria bacterium]
MNQFFRQILSPNTWNFLLEFVFFSAALFLLFCTQVSLALLIRMGQYTPLPVPPSINKLAHHLNLTSYDISEYLCGHTDKKPRLF